MAAIAGDGSLTLRLPDCLAGEHGKYVVIEGLKFAYGHGQVLAALQANLEFAECRRKHGDKGGPRDLSGTGNIVPLQAG